MNPSQPPTPPPPTPPSSGNPFPPHPQPTFPHSRSLLVSDFSQQVKAAHLMEIFTHFGPVETIQIKKNVRLVGDFAYYGIIKFHYPMSAHNAMMSLNERYFLDGRPMR